MQPTDRQTDRQTNRGKEEFWNKVRSKKKQENFERIRKRIQRSGFDRNIGMTAGVGENIGTIPKRICMGAEMITKK